MSATRSTEIRALVALYDECAEQIFALEQELANRREHGADEREPLRALIRAAMGGKCAIEQLKELGLPASVASVFCTSFDATLNKIEQDVRAKAEELAASRGDKTTGRKPTTASPRFVQRKPVR